MPCGTRAEAPLAPLSSRRHSCSPAPARLAARRLAQKTPGSRAADQLPQRPELPALKHTLLPSSLLSRSSLPPPPDRRHGRRGRADLPDGDRRAGAAAALLLLPPVPHSMHHGTCSAAGSTVGRWVCCRRRRQPAALRWRRQSARLPPPGLLPALLAPPDPREASPPALSHDPPPARPPPVHPRSPSTCSWQPPSVGCWGWRSSPSRRERDEEEVRPAYPRQADHSRARSRRLTDGAGTLLPATQVACCAAEVPCGWLALCPTHPPTPHPHTPQPTTTPTPIGG